jgi:hypothetical protein
MTASALTRLAIAVVTGQPRSCSGSANGDFVGGVLAAGAALLAFAMWVIKDMVIKDIEQIERKYREPQKE